MPLAAKIAPHLPNLRRFARLLAGSQKAGDAAVARVLQAIVADPSLFPELPPRIGLYQCFLGAFTTRLQDTSSQADEIGSTAARSLAALPAQARQAFLLVSV
jgi:Sigma2 domain of PhyR